MQEDERGGGEEGPLGGPRRRRGDNIKRGLRNTLDWTEFIWTRRGTIGRLLSVGNEPSCSVRRGKYMYLTEELSAWQEALCCIRQRTSLLLAFTSSILLFRKIIEDNPTLKTGIYWLPASTAALRWTQASLVQS